MTNKTEDRFYFGKHGQPERFAISSSDLNYAKSQIRSASPERLREIEQELLTLAKSGDNNAKTLLAYLKSEWDERYRGTHSRPGQPERFGGFSGLGDWKIDFRNVMKERVDQLKQLAKTLKASVTLDRISPNGYYSGSVSRRYGAMEPPDLSAPGKVQAMIRSLGGYIGAAFSRPGQPERFGLEDACWEGYEPVGTKQKDGRTVPNCVPKDKNEQPEEFGSESPRIKAMESQLSDWIRQRDLLVKDIKRNPNDERAQRHLTRVRQEINALVTQIDNAKRGASFSRPGQSNKFDASSLNRGNFAEASSSPMLGKLLSEKQMPEGGWRAVETGGGALVISFEDGDVAGNFARRVAGSGYSATAPVQSIGRYWNVEVKNG